jgi:Fe-S-cluster-containing dehydrogenase component
MHDDEIGREVNRRDFLRIAGASIALAGLDGCTRMPAEHILPYVDNRPELTPGVAQHYATAMSIDGYATGLIVESHVGRPTKIEGNPDHPASLGASGAIHQASLLQLYDPDRAKRARIGGARASWSAVAATLAPATLRRRVGARGAGLRLLIEPTSSPLDEELLARVLDMHPDASVHMFAPLSPDRTARDIVRHYDLTAADVILAVESDFLASSPFHLRHARHFADGRRLASPDESMNRLYVIESTFTVTGAAADHRRAVRPRELRPLLHSLLAALAGSTPAQPAWLNAIARDLRLHAGRALAIGGYDAPPDMQALIDAINTAIGANGRTVWYAPSALIGRSISIHPFDELVSALRAGDVDTLIIVGGNPSYATPTALGLSTLLRQVPNAGCLGLYENESARDARWFVPMSHYLESWGDARAYDGTLSIVQPLIQPLYESRSPAQLYAALAGMPDDETDAYDLLRQAWAKRAGSDADGSWTNALQRGLVDGTRFSLSPTPPAGSPVTPAPMPLGKADGSVEVIYAADPKVHDGAYSNNGWLQELPAPITKLTWGNAALLSPATARRLGVASGDPVTLTAAERRLEIATLVVPGHADDTVTLHFGYGRDGGELVGRGIGASAYRLWPAIGVRVESGVAIAAGGEATRYALAQSQTTMGTSDPVRRATLAEYRASPSALGERPGRVLSLYPEPAAPSGSKATNQWAMTIDLGTCIGCGACVVACQAENNIPVVGADEVRNGRDMHWIRIDRYFAAHESSSAAAEALFQPMLCQHCERAPCEYVCPVEATVHSADGLNEMVYNRCVGTHFCSNNCPYKVRRFNWFDYNAHLAETELMVKNPNVTVRERGVMEKCTFCVQRIRESEIAAERDGRELRGSEVQTACQQACPTNAIVFGSLTERDSEMVRRRKQPRAYSSLHELGTEPRVRYLARVRNTNPELPGDG